MILGDGGPKNPRCRGAADGSSLQRQEGQQALGTGREQDGHAILLEPEPSSKEIRMCGRACLGSRPVIGAPPGLGVPLPNN